jgi:hypothetical protein
MAGVVTIAGGIAHQGKAMDRDLLVDPENRLITMKLEIDTSVNQVN